MTDNKKYLKERFKLAKYFYKKGQGKNDHVKLLEKSEECTWDVFRLKRGTFVKWQANWKILRL